MTQNEDQAERTTALAVRVGEIICLVDTDSLVEVVRVAAEERERSVEQVGDAHVLWLRGQLVSLLFVHDLLTEMESSEGSTARDGDLSVVIVRAEGRRLALAVDEILDSETIELQPLPAGVLGLEIYRGAGVLSGGGVGLLLNVVHLSNQAGILDESLAGESREDEQTNAAEGGSHRRMVLLEAGSDRRMVIPLERVSRLETVPAAALERTGQSTVMQYRGGLMPIHDLGTALGDPTPGLEHRDELPVVVIEPQGVRIGLAVGEILDIVEADLSPAEDLSGTDGLAGAVVIHDRVSDLIDVDRLAEGLSVRTAAPRPNRDRDEQAAPVASGVGS
jgi:two-component system chemotaxis sensor kinase CheA